MLVLCSARKPQEDNQTSARRHRTNGMLRLPLYILLCAVGPSPKVEPGKSGGGTGGAAACGFEWLPWLGPSPSLCTTSGSPFLLFERFPCQFRARHHLFYDCSAGARMHVCTLPCPSTIVAASLAGCDIILIIDSPTDVPFFFLLPS